MLRFVFQWVNSHRAAPHFMGFLSCDLKKQHRTYFQCCKASVTMALQEIEKIIGFELEWEAHLNRVLWLLEKMDYKGLSSPFSIKLLFPAHCYRLYLAHKQIQVQAVYQTTFYKVKLVHLYTSPHFELQQGYVCPIIP